MYIINRHGEKAFHMKRLILIVILTFSFQSWTKADDISDFEIEGMSIGDSLLDYYTKSEIINTKPLYYNDKTFYQIAFPINNGTYEYASFNLKENDKKYIIHSIKGLNDVDGKKKECLDMKKLIVKDVLSIFKNSKEEIYTSNFNNTLGDSISYVSDFKLDNGFIRIFCTIWDKKNEEVADSGWFDSLNVVLSSTEFLDWLNNKAYK